MAATEKMFECAECKSIFADHEIKRVRHSDGDAWDECPFCGCDELDEVAQCYLCGEWHKVEELRNEICEDCIEEESEKVYQIIEYAECYCGKDTVDVSPLWTKAFSTSEINEILASAFTQLTDAQQKKACRELVSDDIPYFADYLKGEI